MRERLTQRDPDLLLQQQREEPLDRAWNTPHITTSVVHKLGIINDTISELGVREPAGKLQRSDLVQQQEPLFGSNSTAGTHESMPDLKAEQVSQTHKAAHH